MPADRPSSFSGRAVIGRPPDPLRACGLEKRYGAVRALAGLDVRVTAGAVVGLVGPNGSGKSTLLGIVAGIVRADSGMALVAGRTAGTIEAARSLVLVPDDPSGFDELTVREHAALLHALIGVEGGRRSELVEAFELKPLLDRSLGALSRGQRRRAALAAAFAVDVPLILVDEATTALDETAVVAVCDAIADATARGAGVLLATHDREFVSTVCDTVLELRAGEIVAELQLPFVRQPEVPCDPVAV